MQISCKIHCTPSIENEIVARTYAELWYRQNSWHLLINSFGGAFVGSASLIYPRLSIRD